MFGTALISDARKASAVVKREKLAELNDGRSMVFTIARRFTGASFCPLRIEGNRVD